MARKAIHIMHRMFLKFFLARLTRIMSDSHDRSHDFHGPLPSVFIACEQSSVLGQPREDISDI